MPSKSRPPEDAAPDDQLPLGLPDGVVEEGEGEAAGAAGGGEEESQREVLHPTAAVTTAVTPRHLNDVAEMYGHWFLDYASYVILERAVPHIDDGLKPVQRRILHAMERLDDGRFNKVANIVGDTMKYHPHGDAAITDALVVLGLRNLLVETQGNWGNLLTGDEAAAARYIEARLSKFAIDVAFNPKLTTWAMSYDGRNREPVTLPAKFPLLLAQGVEGIAVGLACKILPHNFNELIDACIDALRGKPVSLLPDFPTGAIMDASDYQEGVRGGKVRVRARIEIQKKGNVLRVIEIPFGTTTGSLIESILSANEKGKIKISRVEDCTAAEVDIMVYLPPGTDAEDMLKALYVFTDCEVSISPNCVVIQDDKPAFLNVNDLLRHSAEQTRDLLRQELELRLGELEEKWHFSSLEKIFIEKRIYRDIEECTTWDAVMAAIWKGLKPYLKLLRREVTDDDIVRLTEIRIKRISKYNSFEADEQLRSLESAIEETKGHLANLTRYAVNWFKELKRKYGAGRERRTEIATFGAVKASEAAVATETLYVNREDGYVGWGLKRSGEAICKCSRLDDVIVILEDGTVKVSRVAEKAFFGPKPVYVGIYDRSSQPVFSIIYRDGPRGRYYGKRFRMGGVTRDTVYDLTKGTKGSRLVYFACHQNPEKSAAQKLMLHFQPAPRLRKLEQHVDLGALDIKSRSAAGSLITDAPVKRISPFKG
jgi:topoisomerase-4 subunit A